MGFKKLLKNVKDKYDKQQEKKYQEKLAIESHDAEVNRILDEFTIPQFNDFFKKYLGILPKMKYDKDRDVEELPSRKDYVEFAWNYIDSEEITYGQLRSYALKVRIVVPSFFADNDDSEYEKNDFETIMNTIRDGFTPEKISGEEHLEAQLMIYLQAKFPERKIDRQVTIQGNDKLDILIDNKYAIELKVPSERTHLRNLGAQLEEYRERYPNICAVIFDVDGCNLTQDILDYSDRFKRTGNITSIILDGKKR